MNKTKEYLIPFVGLKNGKHQFEYQLNSSFFDLFEYDEFEKSDILVNVSLDKHINMMQFDFKHKGTINVPCDLTGEEFDLPIKGKMKLIVRFGEERNDDNEELLILPFGEFEINIAQYIYEMIVLSIPQKRVHPGVKDGTLKTEALDKLSQLSIKEEEIIEKENNTEENIDPRWDKLKQLLTDK